MGMIVDRFWRGGRWDFDLDNSYPIVKAGYLVRIILPCESWIECHFKGQYFRGIEHIIFTQKVSDIAGFVFHPRLECCN